MQLQLIDRSIRTANRKLKLKTVAFGNELFAAKKDKSLDSAGNALAS